MAPVDTTSGTAGTEGGGSGSERLINIGRLVSVLRADFPELTVSKVRYLEDRGLLSPTRTDSGYRKYTSEDVRTLRAILSMQRDQYLPLEVIRQRISQGRMSEPGQSSAPDSGAPMADQADLTPEDPTYTLQELCRAAGVDEDFVYELAEFHLVRPAAEEGPAYTETDLRTTRVCHRLARHRLEPRNLRILSSAAEREAALIEQVATPALLSGHGDRREYGLEIVRDLGSLFTQLTQLLFSRELRRIH